MKKYEVAVLLDKNENVAFAMKCKMVDEVEFHHLMVQTKTYFEIQDRKFNDLSKRLYDANAKIEKLEKEIKTLKGEE